MSPPKGWTKGPDGKMGPPLNNKINQRVAMTVAQEKPQDLTPSAPKPLKTTYEKVMEEKNRKSRIVKARFLNPKNPNEVVGPFPLRLYPGKIEMYKFQHNGVYEVPEYVIEHINHNVGEREFHNLLDEKGNLIPKDTIKPTYQFSIIEYL